MSNRVPSGRLLYVIFILGNNMTIRQIIVSCNSTAEATKIGTLLLKKRLIACYDVVPRVAGGYYWPPKKGKIVRAKGTILMAVTLSRHVAAAKKRIIAQHSDTVPFVGTVDIHDVSHDYYHWLTRELQPHV